MCVAQGVFNPENTTQIIVLMALKASVFPMRSRALTHVRPSLPCGWAEPLHSTAHVYLRTFISCYAADALKPRGN